MRRSVSTRQPRNSVSCRTQSIAMLIAAVQQNLQAARCELHASRTSCHPSQRPLPRDPSAPSRGGVSGGTQENAAADHGQWLYAAPSARGAARGTCRRGRVGRCQNAWGRAVDAHQRTAGISVRLPMVNAAMLLREVTDTERPAPLRTFRKRVSIGRPGWSSSTSSSERMMTKRSSTPMPSRMNGSTCTSRAPSHPFGDQARGGVQGPLLLTAWRHPLVCST